jgi:polysaccharide chain length determinant protein (PEP-CTERM system associated)
MLPGKPISSSDVLSLLRRWRWLIIPGPILGLAVAWGVSLRMPDRYRSETVILVVPQRVPESFVRSTVTTLIEDRLRTMGQEILSRTRLEKIIGDFQLYPELRRQLPLEDVIAEVRADVEVEIVKSDSFKIGFTYSDGRVAQKVTERLATLFIEDNLRDREAQAEGTQQFLEAQLDDARRRLIEQEKRLEEYRRRFSGELPSQMDSNLQAIRTTQMQIETVVDALNRDRDRLLVVERTLADMINAPQAQAPVVAIPGAAVGTLTLDQQLVAARRDLAALESRLTAAHPDVQRGRRLVAEVAGRVADVVADVPGETPPPVSGTPTELARYAEMTRLRAERELLGRQIAQRTAEERGLRGKIGDHQARVDAAPTRESELTELMRDYDTVQVTYRTLLSKKEESQIATNLERRQIGEQFRVLDVARVPERPFSPNRPVIVGVGGVLGLMFSLGLVVLLYLADRTFRSETDVVQTLMLPVLAMVPTLEVRVEDRGHWMRRVMSSVAGAVTGIGRRAIWWRARP